MSEENKAFSFSYSGAYRDELEQFKEKYTKKETTEKIKKIRRLDKTVDFVSTMISIFFGLCGTALIITGCIGTIKQMAYPESIVMLIAGIVIIASVPFLHMRFYNLVKLYFAPKILDLIKEIEENQV